MPSSFSFDKIFWLLFIAPDRFVTFFLFYHFTYQTSCFWWSSILLVAIIANFKEKNYDILQLSSEFPFRTRLWLITSQFWGGIYFWMREVYSLWKIFADCIGCEQIPMRSKKEVSTVSVISICQYLELLLT